MPTEGGRAVNLDKDREPCLSALCMDSFLLQRLMSKPEACLHLEMSLADIVFSKKYHFSLFDLMYLACGHICAIKHTWKYWDVVNIWYKINLLRNKVSMSY